MKTTGVLINKITFVTLSNCIELKVILKRPIKYHSDKNIKCKLRLSAVNVNHADYMLSMRIYGKRYFRHLYCSEILFVILPLAFISSLH